MSNGEKVNMNRQEKEKFVADLNTRLTNAQGAFLVDYRGLNVEAMSQLRRELKKVDTEFKVVKNRLLKRASADTATASLVEHMEGPSAIALTSGNDVVAPAKVLVDFSKKDKKLNIKAAHISGKAIDLEGVRELSELPGRDVLLSQALSTMQGVPASLVRVLSGVIRGLLNVLKAIEAEKA